MRRLLLVTALWLGLLGMAEPLLACDMNTPASSCCSTETQGACTHNTHQGIAVGDQALCCASAPVGGPLAVSIRKGDAKPSYEVTAGTGTTLVTSCSLEALTPSAHGASRPRISNPDQRFGAQTYLRTGRLRL